jgi:hypothetical protein
MISGKVASAICTAVLGCAPTIAGAHDEAAFLALMRDFALVRTSRVSYTEVKSLSMLDSTILQSGILAYSAPATITREVHEPSAETYEIVGGIMHVTTEDAEETVDLDMLVPLKAFVEAFRATLSGDPNLLGEHYEIDFTSSDPVWHLSLLPRNRQLANAIESIGFVGRGTFIETIRIDEANGDWSQMTLTPLTETGDAP